MPSEIYKKIFQRTLTEFVGTFSDDSNIIFKNQEEKLIHPGEYGRYREDACKNVLRLVLDKNAYVSDGFVISSSNAISTQCDIIVYNANVAPVVADGIARMFPAEEVRMIAEVKSILKKCELKEFFAVMASCNQDIWNYTYDPAEYLGLTMETTLG